MATLCFSSANFRIELTQPCPNARTYDYVTQQTRSAWCYSGKIRRIANVAGRRKVADTDERCDECRGTGEILTYEGEMIVNLVRTWLPTASTTETQE